MSRVLFPIFVVLCVSPALADVLDLNTALQNTYKACVDIDDNMHDLKVLAGINTAVTAVGTGLGVGATATGFVKASTDKEIDRLEKILERLKNIESNMQQRPNNDIASLQSGLDVYYEMHKNDSDSNTESIQNQIDDLTQKSKKLGNWRTGLLAGNTATNIAGAIIASKTINKDDISGQVSACVSATKDLSNAMMQARLNGEDITEAQNIYTECSKYEFVDLNSIDKRGKGAMISSSVGALFGGVGTITSGMANSNKIRDDNTEQGKEKEKNLNTASNVLSVGATAASTAATVFNATQIAAIKKVSAVSEACTGVLK